jgi:hypothetical protein
MAERVGFEPTEPLPVHVLSRHADSSTLAPLRPVGIRWNSPKVGILSRDQVSSKATDHARQAHTAMP